MSFESFSKKINESLNNKLDKAPITRFFLGFLCIPYEEDFQYNSFKNFINGKTLLRVLSDFTNTLGKSFGIDALINAKFNYMPIIIPLELEAIGVIYKGRSMEAAISSQAYYSTSGLSGTDNNSFKDEPYISLQREIIQLQYDSNNFFMSMIMNILNIYFYKKRSSIPYFKQEDEANENFFDVNTNYICGMIVDRFYVSQPCYLMGISDKAIDGTSNLRDFVIEFGFPQSIDEKKSKQNKSGATPKTFLETKSAEQTAKAFKFNTVSG